MKFKLPIKLNKTILALGSEFDTRLAFYYKGKMAFSKNTGDIAENYDELEKFIRAFVSSRDVPDVIITDLHPAYNSQNIGERLAKEWEIPHLTVQHHLAHIFTALGDYIATTGKCEIKYPIFGIACDGTGYGMDKTIWGGEVFKIQKPVLEMPCEKWTTRIGHLEKQYLIGGELSIDEPARMLISILSKFLKKEQVYSFIKKYYDENEFEVIYNGLQQKFNVLETSSCARVMDAISLMLGFSANERRYKHYPAKMLEKHSRVSLYDDRKIIPRIKKEGGGSILDISFLFNFLARSKEDKYKLAVAAQRYIIEGMFEILRPSLNKNDDCLIFFSGGLAENKIFKKFAEENGIYYPRYFSPGDQDIALGQVVYFLVAQN